MKPEMRRDEAQFWREFEEAPPRILGALLDAATAGRKNLPTGSVTQNGGFRHLVQRVREGVGLERR